MNALTDTHVHLDAPEFLDDLEAVLARSRAAGVTSWVVPAVTAGGFPRLSMLAEKIPGLHAAFGLHPLYISEHRPEHLDELTQALRHGYACAVGECGLDFFVQGLDRAAQMEYFTAQLRLARDFELPVIVHARRSTEEVLLALRRFGVVKGVIHSFGGSLAQAEQLLKQGLHLGFGGPLTYPRASKLRALARELPLERLLVETDAPDQPILGHQGQRNEPAALMQVLVAWSELRDMTPVALAKRLQTNACSLFSLPTIEPGS